MMSEPESAPAAGSIWRVSVGVFLGVLCLILTAGGLRVLALLMLGFDFKNRPFELLILPVAVLALVCCRSGGSERVPHLRSVGTMIAIIAIAFCLLWAAFILWGLLLSTGGFP